jgi:NodT family efflux transporter outer membrane factor (OMF) lipoprotein
MNRAALVCLAVLPLLAGCGTLGSRPRSAEVALPGQFTSAAGRTVQAAELDRWWTLYNDPELTLLTEAALSASTDVRAAFARLEEARATRSSRRSQAFFPNGDLTGSASVTQSEELEGAGGQSGGGGGQFTPVGRSNAQQLEFPVSWELDLFGRRRAASRTIEGDYLAARFLYEGARAAIAGQVAQNLFQARGLAQQLTDAEETRRIAAELARVARIRAERGLAPTSEAARAEAELAAAEAEAARLQADLRALQRAVLVLVGRPDAPVESLAIAPNLYDPPETPAVVPSTLVARRPDVREAQARIQAAAGALTRAELALLPTINLRPSIGAQRQDSDLFTSATGFWSLGANLLVPILDRPRLLAEIGVNRALAEQAVIGYEQAVQTAFSEADRALIQLEADRARVDLLETSEARARSAYDSARTGYQAGLTDLQVLLDAERAWRAQRAALAQARTTALQRSAQVFQALGGGWSPEAPPTPPAAIRATNETRGTGR